MSVVSTEVVTVGVHPPVRARTRVVALTRHDHAYDRCFYPALENLGAQVIDGVFEGSWLWRELRPGDVLHLQWPSFLYAAARSRLGLLRSFARFVALLLLARLCGARLVWTAHNVMPHDPTPFPGMDRLGRWIVIALSHRIFVHGPSAAAIVEARFPQVKRKLTPLLQHGPVFDLYPRTRSRLQARAKLGIAPEAHVLLFIGQCKHYKNVHGLIEAFRALSGDSLLLIAGQFQRDEYRRKIVALAEGDARIRLYPQYIPDDEIQDFLLACDCMVLPYLEVLTSGSVILAFSLGRPVVSMARGFLKDVVNEEVGLLFDPNDPDGLARALVEVRKRHFDEDAILAHVRRFSWIDSARAFLDALDA